MQRLAAFSLAITAGVCADSILSHEDDIKINVESIVEIGVVPRPYKHRGRDVGFSGVLHGRSVWIFGDTFLPEQAEDGLRWRSSSWSWTMDTTSEGGIEPFMHALDQDGLAIQLLPHTSEEAAYNLSHQGHEDCAAKNNCGSRLTPWPQALVVDSSGQNGIIYYLNMETGPDGQWDFRSVSGSIAKWNDPGVPATRIEPPLFIDEEPDWGSAAVLVDEDIYVYACSSNGIEKPCLLARVPFHVATDRNRYLFWDGNDWSEDWHDAMPIFSGGSLFSVHYNAHLGKYLAFYMSGMASEIFVRSAPHPRGPWSNPNLVGTGMPAYQNWDYALIAHPAFSRENGRVEVLSYTQPSGFLQQEIRMIELRLN